MEKVYIETSIFSYLTARPTRSIQAAAWQEATTDWWELKRDGFSLFTWNCRHIANAEKKPLIRRVCEGWGCACPEICTPLVAILSTPVVKNKKLKRLFS